MATFVNTKRKIRVALALGMGGLLAACATSSSNFGTDFDRQAGLNNQLGADGTLPPANGRVLGEGQIRVALLVPMTAQGFGALAAENFTNATELALREFSEKTINVVVKDTGGSPQQAAAAAQEALAEGAQMIIGPVFSNSVPAVASIARPSGVPVLSFSNSANVASRGVNIFGFTPGPGIDRAIRYAGSKGSKSFAALIPNSALGPLAEASFRQSVAAIGGRVVSIARYDYDGSQPQAKAQEVGALVAQGQVDSVFVPDAGDIAPQIITALKQAVPSTRSVRLIGSGQWDDPRIFRNPAFEGAIYAAPNRDGYNKFAQRYNQVYGKPPIRLASLAYDATSLMIVLVQNFPGDFFSSTRLTNPSGFSGMADGPFRLLRNGQVQRALAVYEVGASGPRIVNPAPRAFSGAAAGG